MDRHIVILGGGTAGLLASLILTSHNPSYTVTVVESEKIGIIGVGEGSTEHWLEFMNYCNISIPELVKETGATFKSGIKFINWNGDKDHYWHALPIQTTQIENQSGTYPIILHAIAENLHSDTTVWESCLNHTIREPYPQATAQFHFDTRKLNTYFHKLARDRGVEFFTDDIVDVKLDDQGFVDSIVGEVQTYRGDFFIDASGFNRVISSKLGVKWNDVSEYLPMNRAIAFPTPYQEDIPPYTSATAMSSGWMWRIPTQDRFGNGYVYCDKFISDDDAFAEAQSVFDHPIEVAKSVKFSAGYVDKFWVKNCLNIGLSAMFVEPLEASSIGSTIQQCFGFISVYKHWDRKYPATENRYNLQMTEMAKNIVDFIQLHYFTKRNDSEFWRWCQNGGVKMTPFNKETFECFKHMYPSNAMFNDYWLMFKSLNWVQVMHGLGHLNPEHAHSLIKQYPNISNYRSFLMKEKDLTYASSIPHRQALEIVKTRSYDHALEDATIGELLGGNKWNMFTGSPD